MSRDDPQMKLRLPEGLRDRIKAFADANRRSMNAEIIDRLEQSIAADEKIYGAPPGRVRQQTDELVALIQHFSDELKAIGENIRSKSEQSSHKDKA